MRILANKTNVVAPGGSYSYGRIKDKTGPSATDGTPVSEDVYGDFHQFFERMLDWAGITPNDLPENDTNGYQAFEALGYWQDAGTPAALVSAGSITIDPGDVVYNKFCIQGRKITWQIALNGFTLSSNPAIIALKIPQRVIDLNLKFPFAAASMGFTNVGALVEAYYGSSHLGPDDDYVAFSINGSNFSSGTNNRVLYCTITTELIDR
jgi:hypothetical protein